MKKMLEELKNLDEEVRVPADFTEKVMNRVKQLDKTEKVERNFKKFYNRKYVITSIASAAVILIACFVTLKNGKVASDSTVSHGTMDKVLQTDNFVFSEHEDLEEKEEMAKETRQAQMPSTSLVATAESNTEDSLEENFSYNSANMVDNHNWLIDILKDNKIEVIEDRVEYVIVDTKMERLKEVLNDTIESLEFETLEDGTLKIFLNK